MIGLGKWERTTAKAKIRNPRPKAQWRISKRLSGGKSSLSEKDLTSGSGESAAVHSVRMDLTLFGDKSSESDDDPAVARTVETLTVVEGDASTERQEKETRTVGGIPSR